MNQANKELKQSIVQRIMPPSNEPVSQLARESGKSPRDGHAEWRTIYRSMEHAR